MSTTKISLSTAILLSLLTVWGCQSAGNQVAEKPDTSGNQTPRLYRYDSNLSKGLIGVSMQVAAERVGDTAGLYVAHVPDTCWWGGRTSPSSRTTEAC